MLGLFQIYKQGTCRSDSKREIVHCKALERINPELPLELFHGTFIDKGPLLKGRYIIMVAVFFLCILFVSSRNKKFFRSKRTQKGAYIVKRAFRHLKCTCGDIQKGSTTFVLVICQSGDIVVLLLLQKLLVEGNTRSDKLRNASLYYLLGKLGVFQLVAHRHLVAGTHKPREVCLKRMIWKTSHRDSPRSGTGALCEHDSKHLACSQGIIPVCLVKIAAPEQKHSLGMLRLHGEELLHHRGLGRFLFCHNISDYNQANLHNLCIFAKL